MTAFGTPEPVPLGPPPPGAWQDATGAWHYPYEQLPQQLIVEQHELAPVGPPRHYGPARVARDPRQATMAAVLTFICLIVGLWAVLGFLGSMSRTLSSMAKGNEKVKTQLAEANAGLRDLDVKTRQVEAMSGSSAELKAYLQDISANMGTMVAGVGAIGDDMGAVQASLGTLEEELGSVNTTNAGLAKDLTGINAGLTRQLKQVSTMRGDLVATSEVVDQLPGRLDATNGRLGHINKVVNLMGCRGITQKIDVDVSFTFVNAGSASIIATVVPPGSWGVKADGTPC